MAILRPDIAKLLETKDVDGLRAALHHRSNDVRIGAARALGWLELAPSDVERNERLDFWIPTRTGGKTQIDPPTSTGRQGIVPQEAVADLEKSWRTKEWDPVLFRAAVEAIARIGGPAGAASLIRCFDDVEAHRSNRKARYAVAHELYLHEMFSLLDADTLIEIQWDETLPARVRATAQGALHTGHSTWTETDRVRGQEEAERWLQEREAKRVREEEERAAFEAAGRAALDRFMASAEPSAEEAAHALAFLYDDSPYRGGGFVKAETPAEPVRDIGERLQAHGGFDLMREAHALFAALRPAMARNLEMVWDGIGTWGG